MNNLTDYEQFLERKRHTSTNHGIDPVWIPDSLFDYQKYVAEYTILKGRCADFLDTGTGKTIIELVTAANYVRATNKRVLIITPLAVAFQFIDEAAKFGIDDVAYSKDGKLTSKIVVCNYERLHYFDPSDFGCVILDESSILKNFEGATKTTVTDFLRKVQYRYLFTATPSPNDYIELGTSSEALGYLGYMDMLTKFFANNENNIRPQDIGNKFYLKPHAVDAFFRWVSGWSISMRKPSDLGFDDSRFVLPDLKIDYHYVKNDRTWVVNEQAMLFGIVAKTNQEIRQEQRMTLENRCAKAVELASNYDCSVYWCNLNDEGDLIEKLDSNATQLKGQMKLEQKEEILQAFRKGEIKKLITKPKITSFGLNWQHCGHTVAFPTFSWEQFYQLIRRFWRYGRVGDVVADMVLSDGQTRIMDSLIMKGGKANELFTKLNQNLHQSFEIKTRDFNQNIKLPNFL